MITKLKAEVAELKKKLAEAMLGKVEFAATKTDKAVLVHDVEELSVGVDVFIEDEEGNRTPAEDGIYTLEDGTRINVAEGKVAEILEKEEEVEVTPEAEVEMAEEETTEENTPEYATKADVEALAEAVAELKAMVEALAKEAETNGKEVEARLAKMEQMPMGKTPATEYKEDKEINTGDATLDRKLANIRKFKK